MAQYLQSQEAKDQGIYDTEVITRSKTAVAGSDSYARFSFPASEYGYTKLLGVQAISAGSVHDVRVSGDSLTFAIGCAGPGSAASASVTITVAK